MNPVFGGIATVVIVAAMGIPLAHYWLGRQQMITTVPAEETSEPASESSAPVVAERRVAPPSAPRATAPASRPDAKPAVARASSPPRIQTKGGHPNTSTNRMAGSTTAPVAPAAAAAAAPAPAPEPVAAPPPAPEPVSAPVGPFFEQQQVNEAPRIASRVEPELPAGLQSASDIVVVRVLVAQNGRAAIVNLLRRSRAGRPLDDAVVAAVKQWTFQPARKRGEAVSCWYHIGVPIGRAE